MPIPWKPRGNPCCALSWGGAPETLGALCLRAEHRCLPGSHRAPGTRRGWGWGPAADQHGFCPWGAGRGVAVNVLSARGGTWRGLGPTCWGVGRGRGGKGEVFVAEAKRSFWRGKGQTQKAGESVGASGCASHGPLQAPWGDSRLFSESKGSLQGLSSQSDIISLTSPGLSSRAVARARSPGSPRGMARLRGPDWWGESNLRWPPRAGCGSLATSCIRSPLAQHTLYTHQPREQIGREGKTSEHQHRGDLSHRCGPGGRGDWGSGLEWAWGRAGRKCYTCRLPSARLAVASTLARWPWHAPP